MWTHPTREPGEEWEEDEQYHYLIFIDLKKIVNIPLCNSWPTSHVVISRCFSRNIICIGSKLLYATDVYY